MSNERDNDKIDALVSDTYHELATESTPDDLDRRVLRMAASDRRAEKSDLASTLWMKPLTWAATIGLSLAIVLEVSRVDNDNEATLTQEPPAAIQADSVSEAFVPQDADVLKDASDQVRMRAGSDQPPAPGGVVESAEAADVAEDLPAAPLAAEKSAYEPSRQVTMPAMRPEQMSKEQISREQTRQDPLKEDQLILQGSQDVLLQRQSLREGEPKKGDRESLLGASCDTDSRKTARRWYDCIERLRESGKTEDADREFEAFTDQHPDYLPND